MTDYPELDPATLAAVAEHYVAVVSLAHPEGLTDAQRAEVVSSVADQLAAAERLHRFPLTNADEPAFVLPEGPRGSA